MKTKYCFNCGQKIKTDASFCPECGAQQEQIKTTNLNNSGQNKDQNTNDSYDMDIHKPYNESGHPSIPNSFKLMFRDAFTVKTRMGRADYWYAMLINYVIDIVALIIWGSLFNNHPNSITILLSIVSSLFGIITFTASIRRYHDTNKNGWTICFGLIPLIGPIIQLILLCQPSKNRNNRFYKSSDKEWYKNPISWVLLVIFFFISFISFKTYGETIHTANSIDTSETSSPSSNDDDYSYDDSDSSSNNDEDTGDFIKGPVRGISADDYNANEAANNTSKYSYGNLIKSDDYNGKSYDFDNMTVLQADESNGATTLLVYPSNDDTADDVTEIYYSDSTKAIKGDTVNIKGILGNRDTYDTQSGGSNTVPTLDAKSISVTGHSDDD